MPIVIESWEVFDQRVVDTHDHVFRYQAPVALDVADVTAVFADTTEVTLPDVGLVTISDGTNHTAQTRFTGTADVVGYRATLRAATGENSGEFTFQPPFSGNFASGAVCPVAANPVYVETCAAGLICDDALDASPLDGQCGPAPGAAPVLNNVIFAGPPAVDACQQSAGEGGVFRFVGTSNGIITEIGVDVDVNGDFQFIDIDREGAGAFDFTTTLCYPEAGFDNRPAEWTVEDEFLRTAVPFSLNFPDVP